MVQRPDDFTVGTRAAMDQLATYAREYGQVLSAFYDGLIAYGFTEGQAFTLTRDWLDHMLVGMNESDVDGKDY